MWSLDLANIGDVPAIVRLSNWAAEHTAANFATEPESVGEWEATWSNTADNYPWLVARAGGRVVGFAKASPHRARGAYRWTAEVSVYVDHEWHGKGAGKALYRRLLPILRAQGYVTLLAGITPPNPASERLHAAFGFERCGTYHRAGWKFSRWHDVGYWERHLSPAEVDAAPIRQVKDVYPRVCRALEHGASIRAVPLQSDAARALIDALNRELSRLYPEPGANHFRLDAEEVTPDRGVFVAAFLDDEPVGCGAVRKNDADVAEIKRMFVVPRWRGVGISKQLLAGLEAHAARLSARRVVLETGVRQREAIALYERSGYRRIDAFGEYLDSPLSVCMGKTLATEA